MLEETGYRDTAEEMCRQSIAIQPKNPWGIHTICELLAAAYRECWQGEAKLQ